MPSADASDRCFSVRDLARHWRVAPKRVRALIKRKLLAAFKPGRGVRITPEAIRECERRLAVGVPAVRRGRRLDGIDPEVAALLEGV